MAAFSEERASTCPLGRWGLVAMVETQDSREETMQVVSKNQNPNREAALITRLV